MGFLGTYLKKKLNRPLITSYHGVPFYTDLMSFANSPPSSWTFGDFGYSFLEFPLNEALIKFGLNNSDRIVTCSKTTLSELETRYRNVNFKKSLVIPNGVDFEKLLKIKNGFTEEDINANSSPSILFAGRLYFLKGITYLLEAFELLVGDFPDLRLNIFGTGPMESKIRKTILNQGLEKKIVLHGLVARNQLMQEILKADVAVFPSLREAQPMVVLEAMAFGKPVIAFDFAFAKEIIKDQDTGLLAKRMDARELANGIRILLSDKKTRAQIGQNGCSYVKKHHNWKTLINQYVDLYENVAKEAPH
jgi:glycosyltransferase involved in cell wall biosynthesis